MSILASGYLCCLDGVIWITQGARRPITYTIYSIIVLYGWVSYLIYFDHGTFTGLFTLQIVLSLFTSFVAASRMTSRYNWIMSTCALLLGRVVWEYERSLYKNGLCPLSEQSLEFWLHPMWHVLSALSHFYWMKYASSLRRSTNKQELRANR